MDWDDNSISRDENLNYTFSIMLFLYHCDFLIDVDNESFSNRVWLKNNNAEGNVGIASAEIRITFFSSRIIGYTYDLPPTFDKAFYQLSVYIPNWTEGLSTGLKISTEAEDSVRVPVIFSIDDSDYGSDLFSIHPEFGILSYKNKPTVAYVMTLEHHVGIYQIRAARSDALSLTATVSLVVYFQFDDTNANETSMILT